MSVSEHGLLTPTQRLTKELDAVRFELDVVKADLKRAEDRAAAISAERCAMAAAELHMRMFSGRYLREWADRATYFHSDADAERFRLALRTIAGVGN